MPASAASGCADCSGERMSEMDGRGTEERRAAAVVVVAAVARFVSISDECEGGAAGEGVSSTQEESLSPSRGAAPAPGPAPAPAPLTLDRGCWWGRGERKRRVASGSWSSSSSSRSCATASEGQMSEPSSSAAAAQRGSERGRRCSVFVRDDGVNDDAIILCLQRVQNENENSSRVSQPAARAGPEKLGKILQPRPRRIFVAGAQV